MKVVYALTLAAVLSSCDSSDSLKTSTPKSDAVKTTEVVAVDNNKKDGELPPVVVVEEEVAPVVAPEETVVAPDADATEVAGEPVVSEQSSEASTPRVVVAADSDASEDKVPAEVVEPSASTAEVEGPVAPAVVNPEASETAGTEDDADEVASHSSSVHEELNNPFDETIMGATLSNPISHFQTFTAENTGAESVFYQAGTISAKLTTSKGNNNAEVNGNLRIRYEGAESSPYMLIGATDAMSAKVYLTPVKKKFSYELTYFDTNNKFVTYKNSTKLSGLSFDAETQTLTVDKDTAFSFRTNHRFGRKVKLEVSAGTVVRKELVAGASMHLDKVTFEKPADVSFNLGDAFWTAKETVGSYDTVTRLDAERHVLRHKDGEYFYSVPREVSDEAELELLGKQFDEDSSVKIIAASNVYKFIAPAAAVEPETVAEETAAEETAAEEASTEEV